MHMPGKAANMKLMKLLLLAFGVLVVALVVVLILMLANGGGAGDEEKQNSFIEEQYVLKRHFGSRGGYIGADIRRGHCKRAACSALGKGVEDNFSYTFIVNGKAVYLLRCGPGRHLQPAARAGGSDAVRTVRQRSGRAEGAAE